MGLRTRSLRRGGAQIFHMEAGRRCAKCVDDDARVHAEAGVARADDSERVRPRPDRLGAGLRSAAMTRSSSPAATTPDRPTPANRLGLDYRDEARRLGAPPAPAIDIHTHINGPASAEVYRDARDLYGVTRTFSMTPPPLADGVGEVLGDSIHFIAVPDYLAEDRRRAMTEGFLESIQSFHEKGSRMVKFWAAPRRLDFAEDMGVPRASLTLDAEWSTRAMALAESLGMMFMTHVADPDTWFATKYADASVYGTKRDQYLPLERLLDRFGVPWIGAHMGGWPEDLDFLDGLLERHDNLYLDTSATKWMIRELSKHPRQRFVEFLERWRGRVLFGSDIVAIDSHLAADEGPRGMGRLSSSPEEAFDLYASRYWALRTLFETDYEGESPIADPDLALVDPEAHDEMSAPDLFGKSVPKDLLRVIYRDAAVDLVEKWIADHP